jgi:hypothetical protein
MSEDPLNEFTTIEKDRLRELRAENKRLQKFERLAYLIVHDHETQAEFAYTGSWHALFNLYQYLAKDALNGQVDPLMQELNEAREQLKAAEQDAERLAKSGQALVEGFAHYLTANGYGPSIQMVNCQNSMLHEIHEHDARKGG